MPDTVINCGDIIMGPYVFFHLAVDLYPLSYPWINW